MNKYQAQSKVLRHKLLPARFIICGVDYIHWLRENSEAADHRRVPPGGQSGRRGVLFQAAG